MPTISVDDVVVDEKSGTAIFTVRLDVADAAPVTVNYSNSNLTAANGSDYTAVSGTLTFAPGETVKTISVAIANDVVLEGPENFRLNLSTPSANATIADAFAIGTIIDNDAAAGVPVVAINDVVVDEADKTATFVITLDKPSTSTVLVSYATQNGTALAGSDYTAVSGTLTFAPGETAKTVKVTLLNDSAVELSEAFNLVLSGLVNATSLDPVGTAIIGESDAAPVSTSNISVDDVVVDETQNFADFIVRLDAPNLNPVTVNYSNSNLSAANGSDYQALSGTLTFAPGETVKTVRMPILNDVAIEATENFTLNLSTPSANAKIADAFAIGTIVDNDAASGVPVVAINDVVVDEADKTATFVITLNKPSTSAVSVNYATQNGTALAGSDFTAVSGTLTFAPGETVKTVKVTVVNDAAFELAESFNLVLSGLVNATSLDPVGTAVIGESDAAPVSTSNISVDDVVVDETQGFAEFIVRLDAPNLNPVTVNYSNSNLSATNGSDYTALSGTLTFAPGETVKTVRMPILNDTAIEATENFTLNLSSPSANAKIADAFAIGTIIDNDAPTGVPVAAINDFVVDEAGKTATFVITLNKPSTSAVSMTYATQSGTALAGSDFTAVSGTLTFAPGETVKSVKVTLLNDTVFELAESFNLVLSGLVNATTLDGTGTAVIAENDAPAVAVSNISVDDAVVDETQGFAEFIVRLDAPNLNPVTVNYSNSNLSATNGSDYTALSGTLTFAPGETVKTVRMPILNDVAIEATENFTLNLSTPSANAKIADAFAIGTIVDNDAASGVPVVAINDVMVDEAGKTATFVITLNKPSTSAVSMTYATQSGTALAGSDFTAVSGTLTFAPGETVKTVKVTLLNDSVFEAAESFNLVLSGLVNATTLDGTGTAIIGENDAPAVAVSNISVDDVVVDETQGFAEFIVRLDAPNLNPVTVNYNNSNLTAANGSDYTAFSGTLTFAPGETAKTVRMPIINDTVIEATENFKLNLLTPSANAKIVSDGVAIGSIIDNDATTGTPAASLTDAVVDEANQMVTVTVVLDKPSTGNVSFTIAGQDATAITNSDVRTLTALGKIAFAPGETAKTVTFGLLNDATSESTEVFDVVLSSPVGATIADGRAHIIIPQNDGATVPLPVINVASVATTENKGYVDFVVTLSGPSTNVVSVNFNNTNGTALNGSDYNALAGPLVFAPGEVAKTIRFSLLDDLVAEAQETFTLNLVSPTNATIGNAAATATIIDNESPAPVAPIAIAGTTGNDVLKGTQFADTLTGGAGNDILDGGAGNDSYDGGAGNDIYLLEETGDTYTEAPGGGTDLVISYLSTHSLGGNVENLTLAGSAGTGIGNSGNNTIIGNAGTNTIEGGVGDDILNGGAGTDTVSYSTATAGVTVSLLTTVAQNTVGAGTDTLSNFENIRGSNFNDTLTGNIGNNLIIGGLGNDVLDGGAGTDTASYETATVGVTVSLSTLVAQNTVGAGSDTLSNFENLKGSNFNDTLTGNAANNLIIDSLGNDTLNGLGGTDTVSYETATAGVTVNLSTVVAQNTVGAGTDTLSNFENLRGSNFNDTLTGTTGNNLIIDSLGNDTLDGLGGIDTVSYETATAGVTVNLAAVGIQNTVGAGTDTLSNFENLTGSAFNDNLRGTLGDNVIIGGLGNDTLNGDAGIDTVSYSTATAGVTVNLGLAIAQNTVGAGTDTLTNFENLTGSNLNDTLTGSTGNNTMSGGLGNDTLAGSTGSDNFVFDTTLNATTNNDTITDFSVIDDTLTLENAIFTKFTATGAIAAGNFVSGAGAVAADADDFLIYNTTTGTLSYDADGNGAGAAVAFVTLLGIPALTIADFTII